MKYWDIKPVKKVKKKPWKDPFIYEQPTIIDYRSECLHKNCIGCKNGTCSGVHMISCPCIRCSGWMTSKPNVNVVYQDARGVAINEC